MEELKILACFDYFFDLPGGEGFFRWAKSLAKTGFHFNENQIVFMNGNNVNFAKFRRKITSENPVALTF